MAACFGLVSPEVGSESAPFGEDDASSAVVCLGYGLRRSSSLVVDEEEDCGIESSEVMEVL